MNNITTRRKVKIRTRAGWLFVDPESILFFIAKANSCCAILRNGDETDISLEMKELERKFSTFFRINDDLLINLRYLDKVSNQISGYVSIDNSYRFPIDNDRKILLLNALNEFC
ncbi:MAG: LytTR family transcriptional regulator DNA-binding domain-containing protein [Paludibacteraceae bacterium]|nr:LytTR family transcriptional regulator DNA-binding domain-containing protein [Paludibacteraceae bacterium]